jgi:gluconolactonase
MAMRFSVRRLGIGVVALGIASLCQCECLNIAAADDFRTIGAVERLDPALDEIVPPDAKIEILADGFDWSEGPVWVESIDALLFSDVPLNQVFQWNSRDGLSVFLKPSGFTGKPARGGESGSNGLTLDHQGRLVLCQHGDRRVARLEAPWEKPAPVFKTLADRFEGHRFNSPNDLAYHSDGSLYFTDPPYGLLKNADDPSRELDFCGVYRLTPDGEVQLLTRDLTRPNGIAFSPDEKVLYVAQSDPQRAIWMAYDLDDDGQLENPRVFFDATPLVQKRRGLPDGLKVNRQGILFATGPGGVLVFNPQGKHLGTISTGEAIANCALADEQQTLYMTSDQYLCRVVLKSP